MYGTSETSNVHEVEIGPQSDDHLMIWGDTEYAQSGYTNLLQKPRFKFDNGVEFYATTERATVTDHPDDCTVNHEDGTVVVTCDQPFGRLWELSQD